MSTAVHHTASISFRGFVCRRQLRADVPPLNLWADDVHRAYLFERQERLRRDIESLYDAEEHLIPEITKLRAESQYSTHSNPPHELRILLPSVISTTVQLPDAILVSEFRLRQSQALDALADIRGSLEVNAYLQASPGCYDIDFETAAGFKDLAMSVVLADLNMAVRRYREAYRALEQLASSLRIRSCDWRNDLAPLHSEDVRYITTSGRTNGPPMSWIWRLGGTPFVPHHHLLDIDHNKGLQQGESRVRARLFLSQIFFSVARRMVSCSCSSSEECVRL